MATKTLMQDNFTILLRGFDEIITDYPPIPKVEKSLTDLIEGATLDNDLSFWQKDAVIARCKNYLKGEYGDQVKKDDYRSDYSKGLK